MNSVVPVDSAPVLLPFQKRWAQERAGFAVMEKSRRIGMSWTTAYIAVLTAAPRSGAGNVYYQGFEKDMTRTFIDDCRQWAEALHLAAGEVGEEVLRYKKNGVDLEVQAFRLPFASGKSVWAMTSAPRAVRSKGKPGDLVIIDEAGFVDDLDEMIKSAMAFRMWGGRVRVLSTHNGQGNAFNNLIGDVRTGEIPGALHSVTLAKAIEEGVFRKICDISGRAWSAEAEAEWENNLRAEYGRFAAEELDCIPAAGGAAWLSWDLILSCEHERAGACDAEARGPAPVRVAGVDISRRNHLWVLVVLERRAGVWWVCELREERNINFSRQREIIKEAVAEWRPLRIAVDQTGMGEAVVEQWREDHGARVEGVLLTSPRRLDVASTLRQRMEDGLLRIPRASELRNDLHSIRVEPSATGAPRLISDSKGIDSHSDRFWALALAAAATDGVMDKIVIRSSGRRESLAFDERDNTPIDNAFHGNPIAVYQ